MAIPDTLVYKHEVLSASISIDYTDIKDIMRLKCKLYFAWFIYCGVILIDALKFFLYSLGVSCVIFLKKWLKLENV